MAVRKLAFHPGNALVRHGSRVKLDVTQILDVVQYWVEHANIVIRQARTRQPNSAVVMKPRCVPLPILIGEYDVTSHLSIRVDSCRTEPSYFNQSEERNWNRDGDRDHTEDSYSFWSRSHGPIPVGDLRLT